VLRFKPPSIEELHFIKTIQEGAAGIFANETFLPPEKSRFQTFDDRGGDHAQIRGWGASLLKTATGEPDEEGNIEVDSLMRNAMEPSEEWVEVGSGVEGRVYIEILACNGLPNMDASAFSSYKNLTDAYCCLIMEDSIVNTSIINNTLSPRWAPKDRRAFVFQVHHPSSPLFVGVFDHDQLSGIGKSIRDPAYDPIGRVSINLTQFSPDTVYTLHYHIYPLGNSEGKLREEQTHNGTLIMRLRVEWAGYCCKGNEAKNMITAGMLPPEKSYVAVPNRHDFVVAHYTTVGKVSQKRKM
jgi:C2 domain